MDSAAGDGGGGGSGGDLQQAHAAPSAAASAPQQQQQQQQQQQRPPPLSPGMAAAVALAAQPLPPPLRSPPVTPHGRAEPGGASLAPTLGTAPGGPVLAIAATPFMALPPGASLKQQHLAAAEALTAALAAAAAPAAPAGSAAGPAAARGPPAPAAALRGLTAQNRTCGSNRGVSAVRVRGDVGCRLFRLSAAAQRCRPAGCCILRLPGHPQPCSPACLPSPSWHVVPLRYRPPAVQRGVLGQAQAALVQPGAPRPAPAKPGAAPCPPPAGEARPGPAPPNCAACSCAQVQQHGARSCLNTPPMRATTTTPPIPRARRSSSTASATSWDTTRQRRRRHARTTGKPWLVDSVWAWRRHGARAAVVEREGVTELFAPTSLNQPSPLLQGGGAAVRPAGAAEPA